MYESVYVPSKEFRPWQPPRMQTRAPPRRRSQPRPGRASGYEGGRRRGYLYILTQIYLYIYTKNINTESTHVHIYIDICRYIYIYSNTYVHIHTPSHLCAYLLVCLSCLFRSFFFCGRCSTSPHLCRHLRACPHSSNYLVFMTAVIFSGKPLWYDLPLPFPKSKELNLRLSS